jgi:hypothetical protein
MKKNAKLWLEQFGINVVSTEVVDELAIDAVTTAESLTDFLKKAGTKLNAETTLGGFRFVCRGHSNVLGKRRVSYAVYPAGEGNRYRRLGWLTMLKPAASTKVQIEICNDF